MMPSVALMLRYSRSLLPSPQVQPAEDTIVPCHLTCLEARSSHRGPWLDSGHGDGLWPPGPPSRATAELMESPHYPWAVPPLLVALAPR